MIKDAESHAEEDRKQRELAEARNLAENAAYQAEKQVSEMGDQLDDSAKSEINAAIEAVKGVIDSDDADEIKAKTDAQQAASADGAGADGAGEPEEEVVDAEVVDDERS